MRGRTFVWKMKSKGMENYLYFFTNGAIVLCLVDDSLTAVTAIVDCVRMFVAAR